MSFPFRAASFRRKPAEPITPQPEVDDGPALTPKDRPKSWILPNFPFRGASFRRKPVDPVTPQPEVSTSLVPTANDAPKPKLNPEAGKRVQDKMKAFAEWRGDTGYVAPLSTVSRPDPNLDKNIPPKSDDRSDPSNRRRSPSRFDTQKEPWMRPFVKGRFSFDNEPPRRPAAEVIRDEDNAKAVTMLLKERITMLDWWDAQNQTPEQKEAAKKNPILREAKKEVRLPSYIPKLPLIAGEYPKRSAFAYAQNQDVDFSRGLKAFLQDRKRKEEQKPSGLERSQ